MIQHLCHDPASPECSGILKEYLVGMRQYGTKSDKQAYKRPSAGGFLHFFQEQTHCLFSTPEIAIRSRFAKVER